MNSRQTIKKANLTSPFVGTAASLVVLALVFWFFLSSPAISAGENSTNPSEEAIWKLEEAYFTNLYSAHYEGVLVLVHPQFLGWPGNLPKAIGREESAQFMKKLIPHPMPCTIRIERVGLRRSGDTVLTQYTLHVNCSDATGTVKTQSSRITHTWTRHKGQWKLLGGMSLDIKQQ